MEKVFIDNPKLDVCYKTSDGKYFFTENDAKNYASTLEKKGVKKLVREESTTAEPLKVVKEAKEPLEKAPVKGNEKTTSKDESK